MQDLRINHSENRGSDDYPYGYIYFNDGARVGFSPGMEEDDCPDIWPGNWEPVRKTHLRLAAQRLRKEKYLPDGDIKVRMSTDEIIVCDPANF